MPDHLCTACTPLDVIERSVLLHPSLLAERLRAFANTHADAYACMMDRRARHIAWRLVDTCRDAAQYVLRGDTLAISQDADMYQAAFLAASQLQCIPRSVALEILERHAS